MSNQEQKTRASMCDRVRHKKRGHTYSVVAHGRLQVDGDLDLEKVIIYRADDDGSYWIRPTYEFDDGRFEPVTFPHNLEEGQEP